MTLHQDDDLRDPDDRMDPAQLRPQDAQVLRAGIYIRPGLLAPDLGHQESESRALADRAGWEAVEVYVDGGSGAPRGLPQSGWNRMLADLEGGRLQAVVAYHPRVLGAPGVALQRLLDLVCSKQCPIRTVEPGSYDLSTAQGLMLARMLSAGSIGDRSNRKRLRMTSSA